MKVEKLARGAFGVRNLDDSVKIFSDLLGITFVKLSDEVKKGSIISKKSYTEHASPSQIKLQRKAAVSQVGLELVETDPPVEKEGLRSFHLKASNIEEAKKELKEKGLFLVQEVELGGVKGTIFRPDGLHGVTLVLAEYES